VTPSVVNVRASNEMNKRDDPPIPYSYSLLGCFDEIDNWPVRVLTHQFTNWDGVSASSCINGCWDSGPIDGWFGPHYPFAGVVNGTQCWCDVTLNANAHAVDQDRCNHNCINGPNENCGGSREYQMYFLGEIYGVLSFYLLLTIIRSNKSQSILRVPDLSVRNWRRQQPILVQGLLPRQS
jgi:hypothetical protein